MASCQSRDVSGHGLKTFGPRNVSAIFENVRRCYDDSRKLLKICEDDKILKYNLEQVCGIMAAVSVIRCAWTGLQTFAYQN